MISTDFAPNESGDDAWLSFKLIFQPWRWLKGKETKRLRKEISHFFETDNSNEELYVNLFLSGRGALYCLLQTLTIPKGSAILIQGFTCEAVVLPIRSLGYTPIFIDIDPNSYSMSMNDLKKKCTPNAKVLILQHTFGITPDRTNILKFAQDHNITVIEDLAHGFDTEELKNNFGNSIKLLSYGRSKAISSVFGGAIVTSSEMIAKLLTEQENILAYPNYLQIMQILWYKPLTVFIKSSYDIFIGKLFHLLLNNTGILPREISSKEKNGNFDYAFAKQYPNVLSILLLHQLEKFNLSTKKRIQSVLIYQNYFNNNFLVSNNPALIRYPIITDDRIKLLKRAQKKHIYLGKWYDQVIGPKGLNMAKVGYTLGDCPIAEDICEKIVNLPALVSKKEAERIIKLFHQKKKSRAYNTLDQSNET
ncbi:MAG: aminotransferase class I/II-fold pyridoxal phosphate-dependent enzyme [Candidatus Roizmanbacteria bacterium]